MGTKQSTIQPSGNGFGLSETPDTAHAAEELSPKRLGRARAMYRSYYKWLRVSRMLMAAFLGMAIMYFLWIVPWLPTGLDTVDYSPKVAFTIYLLVSVVLLGLITLAIREWAWRKRESLMAWSIVYDGATGLHNRTYFIDRLTLECDRSERSGRGFSVLALNIRAMSSERDTDAGISEATMQRTAEVINSQTHPSDLVGHLSATELAILAIGVDREHRRKLLDRLREAVASDLSAAGRGNPKAVVTGGAATYGVDGEDPMALIQAARSAATMGSASARSNARSQDAA